MREREVRGLSGREEKVEAGEVDVRGDVERIEDEGLGEGGDGEGRGGEEVVVEAELKWTRRRDGVSLDPVERDVWKS